MKILVVGSGGVGSAFAPIAARRDFYEHIVFSDIDEAKAQRIVDRYGARRQVLRGQARCDRRRAGRRGGPRPRLRRHPERRRPALRDADLPGGVRRRASPTWTWRCRSPEPTPSARTSRSARSSATTSSPWPRRGQTGGCSRSSGLGTEPGASDVFARYAADHLFSEIDEVGVRDGANLEIEGYDFAPTFSIWTTIEECLNPPVIWERDRGWFTTAPFSEPETFTFPEGIGDVECVNVEHEEVVLVPRWVDCRRVTFKYGLGDEFIEVLETLHKLGLDRVETGDACAASRSPRATWSPPRSPTRCRSATR